MLHVFLNRSVSLSLLVAFVAAGCAAGTTTDDPPDPGDGGVAIVDAAHDGAHVTAHDGGVDAAANGDDTGVPSVSSDAGTPDTGQIPVSSPDANAPDTSVPDTSVPETSTGGAVKPAQGELLITEVMYNPTTAEPDTEWFEVTNTASGPRLLSGLTLADGSGHSETIGSAPAVAPGAYVVLARSKASATGTAKVPAASIVYEYATLTLANSTTGAITIKDGATTIAQSPYGNFAISSTAATANSIQLKALAYTAESTASNWCLSKTAWASGSDNGSPGTALNCQ